MPWPWSPCALRIRQARLSVAPTSGAGPGTTVLLVNNLNTLRKVIADLLLVQKPTLLEDPKRLLLTICLE
jgi:hypothetical protein